MVLLNNMEQINKYIIERLHINKAIDSHIEYNYHPKTRDELEKLIYKLIKERGNEADLNDIDTSEIKDMDSLFHKSEFNGDISNWNASNVKDMSSMFESSKFNGDISEWDVSNVKNMFSMFNCTPLEKNPPKWYKD